MIKEEYVQKETAKLLKEAGFPQNDDYDLTLYLAQPSQARAMRWLRDEHKISVEPQITLSEDWSLGVWEFRKVECIHSSDEIRFPTYESAAEAGIQAACDYIINHIANVDKKV